MDHKQQIKHFYEQMITENCVHDCLEYVAVDCVIRIGEQLVIVGANGMLEHMLAVRTT